MRVSGGAAVDNGERQIAVSRLELVIPVRMASSGHAHSEPALSQPSPRAKGDARRSDDRWASIAFLVNGPSFQLADVVLSVVVVAVAVPVALPVVVADADVDAG